MQATLTHPVSGDVATVALDRGHVLSWTCAGKERLFLSAKAEVQAGEGALAAIRGGIPLCWPQFAGRGPLPKHGFARTTGAWQLQV